MKYIFIDFEMNSIAKSNKEIRKKCRCEIIEIGAVMLNESYNEVSAFKTYVKPQYNDTISRNIEELTGIDMNMLLGAPSFNEAIDKFTNWCTFAAKGTDYCVYAWSDSDIEQLVHEMLIKDTRPDFAMLKLIAYWKDFQKIFGDLLGAENQISLGMALGAVGEKFDGKMHDALCDARNTSRIFRLTSNEAEFCRITDTIRELLKPSKPMTYTLGDMFNFKLCFSENVAN